MLLSTANLAVPQNLTRKLSKLYEGPFVVEAKVGENAYRLGLPAVKLHPVFNVSQLRPYHDPSEMFSERTADPSPPVVIDGENEWEVEAVISHRDVVAGQQRRRQYLVKWVGYSTLHNTWEPEELLDHARTEVDRYLQRPLVTAGCQPVPCGRAQDQPPGGWTTAGQGRGREGQRTSGRLRRHDATGRTHNRRTSLSTDEMWTRDATGPLLISVRTGPADYKRRDLRPRRPTFSSLSLCSALSSFLPLTMQSSYRQRY